MHRDPGDLHAAESGQHRPQILRRRSADRTGDHHDLAAVEIALDDLAQLLGVGADNADPGHLGPGVAGGRGQRVGVDVENLGVARRPGDVDQLAPDAHHRHPGPRMHQHALAADRGQQSDLCGADDRPGAHGDVAGLHVITGPSHIGPGPHPAQNPHPGLAPVGPPQGQHGVGQRGHRCAGLDTSGLLGLQPARRAGARLDDACHRQHDLGFPCGADVDAAHRVAVDGRLVEAWHRMLGDHLFGAHEALRLRDGYPDRPWGHGGSRHPGLLLLNRTHSAPFHLETHSA